LCRDASTGQLLKPWLIFAFLLVPI
jgi:hypothetical protein